MTRIRIKRVYEAPAPDDGCRVLVDKLWPRGVRKAALQYDVWAREIACVAGRAGVRPRNRRCGHGDATLRLEKCGGEPCAHPAGVFAESCRRGYNRVIFAIFASPCPGSGWKTMISAS